MGRACSTYEIRNAYAILVRQPEEKRHLGEPDIGGKIVLN